MIPDEIIFNLVPIAIAGITGLLVGGVFGWLFNSSNKPGKDITKSDKYFKEQFTLLQHRKSGEWVIEVAKRKYSLDRDLNEQQKRNLYRIVSLLASKLQGAQPASPDVPQVVKEKTPVRLPSQPQTPVRAPGLNLTDVLSQAVLGDIPELDEKPAKKSIISQINEILQRKIAAAGEEKKGVRLIELPTKGMVVLVGLQQYETVDDVPDEKIRTLIKESVREWEASVDQEYHS